MNTIVPWAAETILPHLARPWIVWTTRRHARRAMRVAEFTAFPFEQFFSRETLDAARVVVVDRIPVPRMPQRLSRNMLRAGVGPGPRGLTLKDYVFIRASACLPPLRSSERAAIPHAIDKNVLLFHELVHVVQWRVLGETGFLRTYFRYFFTYGYFESPLEQMAFSLHARFERSPDRPFHVEAAVRRLLAD